MSAVRRYRGQAEPVAEHRPGGQVRRRVGNRARTPCGTVSAGEVIWIGERYGFADWQLVGRIHLAAALTNGSSAALDEMATALETCRAIGAEFLMPALYVEQAEGYLARNNLERARCWLDRAFEGMRSGQRFGLPHALAIRAELRLRADPSAVAAADRDLRKAIAVGRGQGDVYSLLGAALAHHRLLRSAGDELVDTALADAVAAYRDASAFPDLVEERALVAASRRVRRSEDHDRSWSEYHAL